MKALILESERLKFIPLNSQYCEKYYVDWMNDEEVFRFLESGGDYTLEKLKGYLNKIEDKPILFWAIVTKCDKHIGNIKIDPIDFKSNVGELGLMLGDKTQWGKGYSVETLNTIIQFCFSEPINLRKITLGVVEDNKAALMLYRKLNFLTEGIFIKHSFHINKWCNVVRMAIFNPNF